MLFGNGTCYYVIGVEDDGFPLGISQAEMEETLKTLYQMASKLKAELILKLLRGKHGEIAFIKVWKEFSSFVLDLKVYLFGDEDAGKSTTLGVLLSGVPDNGNGSVWKLKHKHEYEEGKQSTLQHIILGLDGKGRVTNINPSDKR